MSGSAGDGIIETLRVYSRENYSNQVLEWTIEIAIVQAVEESRLGRIQ